MGCMPNWSESERLFLEIRIETFSLILNLILRLITSFHNYTNDSTRVKPFGTCIPLFFLRISDFTTPTITLGTHTHRNPAHTHTHTRAHLELIYCSTLLSNHHHQWSFFHFIFSMFTFGALAQIFWKKKPTARFPTRLFKCSSGSGMASAAGRVFLYIFLFFVCLTVIIVMQAILLHYFAWCTHASPHHSPNSPNPSAW